MLANFFFSPKNVTFLLPSYLQFPVLFQFFLRRNRIRHCQPSLNFNKFLRFHKEFQVKRCRTFFRPRWHKFEENTKYAGKVYRWGTSLNICEPCIDCVQLRFSYFSSWSLWVSFFIFISLLAKIRLNLDFYDARNNG